MAFYPFAFGQAITSLDDARSAIRAAYGRVLVLNYRRQGPVAGQCEAFFMRYRDEGVERYGRAALRSVRLSSSECVCVRTIVPALWRVIGGQTLVNACKKP